MSVSITIIFIPFTHPDRHVPGFLCVNLIKHVIILSAVVNTKVAAIIFIYFYCLLTARFCSWIRFFIHVVNKVIN